MRNIANERREAFIETEKSLFHMPQYRCRGGSLKCSAGLLIGVAENEVAKGGIELTVVAAAAASTGSRCLVIHFIEV
jgi:hypothetical protein